MDIKKGRGRPLNSRNRKHTNRSAQVTLRVDPELLAEWRAGCDDAFITMSARFEQLIRRDITPITAEQAEKVSEND